MQSQIGTEQDGSGDGNAAFGVALLRAGGGAVIFALPLFMTMEMWWLGFHMDRTRLALFLLVMIPVLTGLAHYAGFKEEFRFTDCLVDAFVAYAVAALAGAAVLLLLSVVEPGMSWREVAGKIAVQAIPGSVGAMLARSQLGGGSDEEEEERRDTWHGELFIAGVGALFLAFNVAPTEEMVLISHQMTRWHGIALVIASLAVMHAFVYAAHFHGQASYREGESGASEFARITIVAYVISLLVSLYVLWSFEHTQGLALDELLMTVIVLGFPASIGAAAARLIL